VRCVVTGGAGFIGSHLVDALVARGDDVIVVDNLVSGDMANLAHLRTHPRLTLVEDDVTDWANPVNLDGVDTVYHQAASKMAVCRDDPELDLRVNALATLRLLTAAREASVRKFVHASTGSVLDGRPVSYYGASKLAGECYVRIFADDLDTTILRYYHVIGPRQNATDDTGGVAAICARRARQGLPLIVYGDGEQERSFTSVFDVVEANLMVTERPQTKGQTYNCASGIRVTVNELAEHFGAAIEHQASRPGDVRRFEIDNSGLIALGLRFDTDWRSTVDLIR
jgi:nucleoside-diphosphate-sugar epimerase